VVNNVTVNKVSYNGGAGGVAAAPTPQERAAAQEQHVAPTPMQQQHVQEAIRNPALAARANGGHPPIAATPRPAAFNAPGVVGARGATMPPPHASGTPGAGQPPPHAPSVGQPNAAQPQALPGKPGAPKPPPKKAPPKKAPTKEERREPEH
jgi:hypothetical protein